MSAQAMIFTLSMMVFVGILFGGLITKLIDDAREIRRIKEENRKFKKGEINQVDFISLLTAYENAQRAEANRKAIMETWISNCNAEKQEAQTKAKREKQKKQIADQLSKAAKA